MPNLQNQKGFAPIVVLIILAAGLGVGLYLVQNPTVFRPKASEDITLSGLQAAFGSQSGDSRYDERYDANRDGYINIQDFSALRLRLLAGIPSPTPTPTPQASWWRPAPGTSWQWQLTEELDSSIDAQVYDIDWELTPSNVVRSLQNDGRKVICYINVGAWEDFRQDADQFPENLLGNEYSGFPDERWLDIRRIDLLGPIMQQRLDTCQDKGFDAVEPDNIDGYLNDTGFPLTFEDQIEYNRWLADQAHQRGLSIGLKNDPEQVRDLLPDFDWALTESCFAQGWCDDVLPFIEDDKAVFAAEYTDETSEEEFTDQVCPQANSQNFDAILKNRDLDAYRVTCR